MGMIEDAERRQQEAMKISKGYQNELKEKAKKTKENPNIEKNYQGLGGWLILVGMGLVLGIFQQFVDIFNTSGDWITISISVLSLGLFVYIAYLFFSESRKFPKWYIGLLIFGLVISAIMIAGGFGSISPEDMREISQLFVRSVVSSIIWIPYMLISKRVKATFIK